MKRALVIGINGYGFPNELPSCVRDAEMFGNILEAVYRFDHVRVLKDGEATKDGVDRGLEWLCQSASANDRLVLFFSGHGTRYDKNGVIEEALVLQDGRLLEAQHLAERTDNVPPGVLTVVIDAAFSGLDETLLHPSGQLEIPRAKRWVPTDADRGRPERSWTQGAKAFTPFGHSRPVSPAVMAGQARAGSSLDPSPARITPAAEPRIKAMLVLPCLIDETTTASTGRTNGLSPFTYSLINAIRRLGHNRSSIELLQATGYELRQLGLSQTPLVMEPEQPERLGLRAFLTFQPVLFVYPSSTPGSEGEEELTRSIAEAVRSTFINMKEGRSMHATLPGGQTFLGEDVGTIVNTVTPIVASLLQNRSYQQPYGGAGGFSPFGFGAQGFGTPGFGTPGFGFGTPGWMGSQGSWGGGFGHRGQHEEIAQIVGAVVPAVLMSLQNRGHQPYLPGFQPQHFQGQTLQPYEIAQIVSTVAPIVTSLIQSRGYQGHLGQFMPRAA